MVNNKKYETNTIIKRSKVTMWIKQFRIIAVSIVVGLAFLMYFYSPRNVRRRHNQVERDEPNGMLQQVRYRKEQKQQQEQRASI